MTKKLFVGGIPYSLTQDEIKSMFSEVGAVSSCNLITDKLTGQSKGFAFVEMENDSEADKAIETLNGKDVNGRKIAVSVARPREESGSGNFDRGRRDFRDGGHKFNKGGYRRDSKRY